MTQHHVVFSHGQESGPWGTKITALAQVVRGQGWEAHSVDYRGMPQPLDRVARLEEHCRTLSGQVVLAGSSVGGYVSVAAAPRLHPQGVFVIAPALHLPQLPPLEVGVLDCPVSLVHGWRDDIVPYQDSVRFAHAQQAALHLLPGDHLLHEQLGEIQQLLTGFLAGLRRT